MSAFQKEVLEVQLWSDGVEYIFDPDSSPEAWKHYRRYYNGKWKSYDFETLHFFRQVKTGIYEDAPQEDKNRLYALPVGVEPCKTNTSHPDQYLVTERLAGDTDFNFNEKKCLDFEKKLVKQYSNHKEDLDKYISELKRCRKMYHTVLNFSLMQTLGNMQGAKSKGIKLKTQNYEWLDRLDSFVFMLNEYFECDKKAGFVPFVVLNASDANRESLQEYLNRFGNIYEYCKLVYFLEEKKLIDDLIENGKKPIVDGKDVVRYMSLAIRFWNAKENYFDSVD